MTVLSSTLYLAAGFFGDVAPPPGVAAYDQAANGGLGLVLFISAIIRLITIIAGLFSLFNLIIAGFTYVTAANNVKAVETAWQSIMMSLIGLVVIVGSFAVTGIASYLLFGDATFILNPQLTGAGSLPTP